MIALGGIPEGCAKLLPIFLSFVFHPAEVILGPLVCHLASDMRNMCPVKR